MRAFGPGGGTPNPFGAAETISSATQNDVTPENGERADSKTVGGDGARGRGAGGGIRLVRADRGRRPPRHSGGCGSRADRDADGAAQADDAATVSRPRSSAPDGDAFAESRTARTAEYCDAATDPGRASDASAGPVAAGRACAVSPSAPADGHSDAASNPGPDPDAGPGAAGSESHTLPRTGANRDERSNFGRFAGGQADAGDAAADRDPDECSDAAADARIRGSRQDGDPADARRDLAGRSVVPRRMGLPSGRRRRDRRGDPALPSGSGGSRGRLRGHAGQRDRALESPRSRQPDFV